MENIYTVYDFNPADGLPFIEFTEFDDAASYCDAHGIDEFYDDDYGAFRKCWFCEEWFDKSELNSDSECWCCEMAIRSHMG